MNEDKLNQILNKIGQTDVPPEISMIAEKASQNFSDVLKIPRPKQSFFTPLRLIAATAVIVVAFSAGRWSKPAALPEVAASNSRMVITSTNKNPESFWQQKVLAATQPRPYARTQFDQIQHLNSYKQYLKEKHND